MGTAWLSNFRASWSRFLKTEMSGSRWNEAIEFSSEDASVVELKSEMELDWEVGVLVLWVAGAMLLEEEAQPSSESIPVANFPNTGEGRCLILDVKNIRLSAREVVRGGSAARFSSVTPLVGLENLE